MDVHVGKVMFNEGIVGLLNNAARVIVMNSHLDLLQYMDEIIIMDKGRIAYKGAFKEVMNNDKYMHLLPKMELEQEEEKPATIWKQERLWLKSRVN